MYPDKRRERNRSRVMEGGKLVEEVMGVEGGGLNTKWEKN